MESREGGGGGEGPESLGKSGPRPWSPDKESRAESGIREGGGNRVVGKEGTGTYLMSALPPPPPPAPLRSQAGEEEVAGLGCTGEGGDEEGPGAASQGPGISLLLSCRRGLPSSFETCHPWSSGGAAAAVSLSSSLARPSLECGQGPSERGVGGRPAWQN